MDNKYEHDAATRKATAAFYTKDTSSTLLSGLTIDYWKMDKEKVQNNDGGPIKIGDFAVGAGMLLVAAVRAAHEQKYNKSVLLVGCDIDRTALIKCVKNLNVEIATLHMSNITHDIRLMPFGDWLTDQQCWRNGCKSDPPKQMGLDGSSDEVRCGSLELIRDGVVGEQIL